MIASVEVPGCTGRATDRKTDPQFGSCGKLARRRSRRRYGWVTGGGALSPWRKLARSVSLTSGSPGRDVVELAGEHPLLELGDQREQVVERIDDVEQRLVVVDLEAPG